MHPLGLYLCFIHTVLNTSPIQCLFCNYQRRGFERTIKNGAPTEKDDMETDRLITFISAHLGSTSSIFTGRIAGRPFRVSTKAIMKKKKKKKTLQCTTMARAFFNACPHTKETFVMCREIRSISVRIKVLRS